jgi:hypothetical protein
MGRICLRMVVNCSLWIPSTYSHCNIPLAVSEYICKHATARPKLQSKQNTYPCVCIIGALLSHLIHLCEQTLLSGAKLNIAQSDLHSVRAGALLPNAHQASIAQ